MRLPFCDHHISAFFQSFEGEDGSKPLAKPLDRALSDYLRAHKSIGANDRRIIADTVYRMVRWKSLIDHFCKSPLPVDRLAAFRTISLDKQFDDPSIPEPVRFGMPPFLYDRFLKAFGPEKAKSVCRVLNGNAPITIRANTIKTTRDGLLEKFKAKSFSASPCLLAPAGILFEKRAPLFSLPEFKEGLFEMQDEGSQLIAALVEASPGEHILDYCSGSGGKTLAFAPSMQGKGQIYLHDIRPWILLEAKKRLKRAGIQNAQVFDPNHPRLKSLKGKMDCVLADVPCSGTGSLRRNPDAKWKIDKPMIDRLVSEQRAIVSCALEFVKPGGRFVYATCSILPEENQEQMAFLLDQYPLVLEKEPLNLFPQPGGTDGFFAAVFRKKESCYATASKLEMTNE